MRAFFVSLAVFISITALVIVSSYYVTVKCDALGGLTENFPEDGYFSPKQTDYDICKEEFADEWARVRTVFRYILGHERANTIDNLRDEMDVRFYSGDLPGYFSARRELISYIEIIAKDEKISLDGLF